VDTSAWAAVLSTLLTVLGTVFATRAKWAAAAQSPTPSPDPCWHAGCLLAEHPGEHWGADEQGFYSEWSEIAPAGYVRPFVPTMDVI
jgi:hypothetical protein